MPKHSESTILDQQKTMSRQNVESPIPTMTAYYNNAEEKNKFLLEIFDHTAPDYDRMERLLGLGSGSWYRGQALQRAGLSSKMRVIDVAVGTGLVAREAVRIVGDADLVIGVDPSPGMLESAKVPTGVRLIQGRAEEIPFPDESFNFLSMGYALRHITDLSVAFREFHRVLKPGARICLLEITPPKSRLGKALLKTYMRSIVPSVGRLFVRSGDTVKLWQYYWDTIEACVPPESVIATLQACGFENVRRVVNQGIFSEYQAVKGGDAKTI
jgi:demethylmenaquinone methyltransferase / 2-methoxy-6-polyprenyl-1,4-benzoquinol methylase